MSEAADSNTGSAGGPDAEANVSVAVVESPNGWTIRLSPAHGSSSQSGRLGHVADRLRDLDAMVSRTLARGKSVSREVARLSSPLACRVRPDGVFWSQDLVRPLLLPRKIADSLYPYQRRGVSWLLRNRRALLADDMGLGKTAQALGAARRLIRSGRVSWGLVVAPRTLITNWVAESKKWAPELCVLTLQPVGDGRGDAWKRAVRRGHLLVTSYEQLRDPPVGSSAISTRPVDCRRGAPFKKARVSIKSGFPSNQG